MKIFLKKFGLISVKHLKISVAIVFVRYTERGGRLTFSSSSKYDDVELFSTSLNVLFWAFSILYVSWFEQKCHSMEQYRKIDSMKALNNFSLLSLDRNLDTRLMAFICLDAHVHIAEICLWKVNLLSIKMPRSLTHSLCAKSWPWNFITGSLQWPSFIMITWNFDGLAHMWLECVHTQLIILDRCYEIPLTTDVFFQKRPYWACTHDWLRIVESMFTDWDFIFDAMEYHCCRKTSPLITPQIAKFMGPTWGPPGSCRPQVAPMLTPWTLLSGTETNKWIEDLPTSFEHSQFKRCRFMWYHYNDVIMGSMSSQITSLTIVYSDVCSGADQRKHQSSASLAFGIHRGRWIPAQRASNAENVSIWWRHRV